MATITATLNYCKPFSDAPLFQYVFEDTVPPNVPQRNFTLEDMAVDIRNARGTPFEQHADLDVQGFAFVQHACPLNDADWNSEKVVTSTYYKTIENLLLEIVPGAKRVFVYHHIIRRLDDDGEKRLTDTVERGPVRRVHVDQTPKAAVARAHQLMGEEVASRLLKKRFRLINVWRPIINIAVKNPLGVCDAQSVAPSDLRPTARITPDDIGNTFNVVYNKDHRWWYMKDMSPDQILLIKCFDSREDVAQHTPHSGFTEPLPTPGPHRQSIEVRALVFDEE